MVCENMAEDLSEGTASNTIKIDQFTSVDDYAPKVRKPYTITKQRERWSEEEHKKFLEALKLHGRAWRRIEEHVGTKTAVQIRSHAQKFFSKVVRESISGDASEVKPIEIPPPRPKRKPMHPYPRKLATPIKTGGQHERSTSPNSSGSDQEHQSPTSVLSAGGSNIFRLGDSGSPNTGSSPVSSANGVKSDLLLDENESSTLMKVESCGEEKENENEKESSPDIGSTQSLKLFGKTVMVTDTHRPSLLNDVCEGNMVNTVSHTLMPVSSLPCGTPVYYMQFLDENSQSSTPMAPWWTPYGGLTYPLVQPTVKPTSQNGLEMQNEGSLTGSNTGDTESGVKEEGLKPFLLVASERSAFTKQCRRDNNGNKNDACKKGFVPYKRCLEQNTHSNGEEREEQRVRLCL